MCYLVASPRWECAVMSGCPDNNPYRLIYFRPCVTRVRGPCDSRAGIHKFRRAFERGSHGVTGRGPPIRLCIMFQIIFSRKKFSIFMFCGLPPPPSKFMATLMGVARIIQFQFYQAVDLGRLKVDIRTQSASTSYI